MTSDDGARWWSTALIAEPGIDLRDPKFSITPDDRLMIVVCGKTYDGERYLSRQPRVMFSSNGREWSAPERIAVEGDWLWRVVWYNGRAYGMTYRTPAEEWTITLVSSADGRSFEDVMTFDVPGQPNETTLRFLSDGTMVALVRRETGNRLAWIGHSRVPYTEWAWRELPQRIEGPNFIQLPGGELWAAGRTYPDGPKTAVGRVTLDGRFESSLTLPSGGDTGYPGMVWYDDRLWVSYYASHEGKASIFLAQLQTP